METSCPNCRQRLSYPNLLKNPVLRCRRCQTQFRPETATPESTAPAGMGDAFSPDSESDNWRGAPTKANKPGSPQEEYERYFAPQPAAQAQAPATPAKTSTAPGWLKGGSAWFVIAILVFRIGPKLLREFMKERGGPPPVQRQR